MALNSGPLTQVVVKTFSISHTFQLILVKRLDLLTPWKNLVMWCITT